MARQYSRLATVEERKNIRRAILFGVLTILAIVFVLTLGLPTLVKYAGFFTDLGKSEKPIDKTDTIPPAPPHINTPVEYTNQTSLTISGTSEPGVTVKIYFNDTTQEVLADKDGNFSLNLNLNKGENTVSATAKDAAGNVSQKTQTYTITYDNQPPDIQITSPSNGTQFFGDKQKQLSIKGKTESGASVTINDRLVVVEDDGSFTFVTTLSQGDNHFDIKATDKAGNMKETSLTVSFSP